MATIDVSRLPAEFQREAAAAVSGWVQQNTTPFYNRSGQAAFDRRAYEVSSNHYEKMDTARRAVSQDDIVSGLAEVTEGLMFQGIKFESLDPNTTDVFNQLAGDLNLDDFIRKVYRELYTYSQVVVAMSWSRATYRPRKPAGVSSRRTRKVFDLEVPSRLAVLDSAKILPVVNSLGVERLFWRASRSDLDSWRTDPWMSEIVLGPCTLPATHKDLDKYGLDPAFLLELNPVNVWRHTNTKPDYAQWADIRMESVFPLLDLKQQLMAADRAALVGNARYMVLMRLGTDDLPAQSSELAQLKEKAETVASLPVVVGDHRLTLDIVSPSMDLTLDSKRYDTLDRRILARMLGSLTSSSTGQRNESTLTVAKMVGRTLESKRHMIKRAFEAHVVKEIVRRNADQVDVRPSLTYYPSRIELDTEAAIITAMEGARIRGDLSRETFLEFLGQSQDNEAMRRIMEADTGLDDVFNTVTPYDSPENNLMSRGITPTSNSVTSDSEEDQ